MRLQIVVDDAFGNELQTEAHNLGLSTSSYVRFLLKQAWDKKQPNEIDVALNDLKEGIVETITLENFKHQLKIYSVKCVLYV